MSVVSRHYEGSEHPYDWRVECDECVLTGGWHTKRAQIVTLARKRGWTVSDEPDGPVTCPACQRPTCWERLGTG